MRRAVPLAPILRSPLRPRREGLPERRHESSAGVKSHAFDSGCRDRFPCNVSRRYRIFKLPLRPDARKPPEATTVKLPSGIAQAAANRPPEWCRQYGHSHGCRAFRECGNALTQVRELWTDFENFGSEIDRKSNVDGAGTAAERCSEDLPR